jgi:uracil-DNA glycosylase family 4
MSERKTYGKLNYIGSARPKVLVICDAPSEGVWERGMTMANPHMNLFGSVAERIGFRREDFCFITPCQPVPTQHQSSESRLSKWIENDREDFCAAIEGIIGEHDPKMVIAMGKVANRQLANRAVAITKARGSFTKHDATGDLPVLPVFSPAHVLARPENMEVFESDLRQAKDLRDCGWSIDGFRSAHETTGYEWCLDLQPLLENPPKKIALDCETVGLEWHKDGFRVLTVALTTAEGNAFVVPLDADYWNNDELRGESSKGLQKLSRRQMGKLRRDLVRLLANPTISVVGHNLSFDIHSLRTKGIEVAQWFADTIQLAFTVDENMQSKSLADCTRRWVPALAGYSDLFDSNTDKSRMHEVGHDEMLEYAGGDTDATFRLAKTLLKEAREDSRNWRTFTHVQMPALRAFVEMEQNGVLIDKGELRNLEAKLKILEEENYAELIGEVDPKVLRRHEEKGWSFGRPEFTRDILFSPRRQGGLGLTPLVFTKTTADLAPEDQLPSTSVKDHLAFFDDNEFVQKLISYQKLAKMRSTYVGLEGKEIVEEVKRLKGGGLPKKVRDAFEKEEIEIPNSTAVRRRRRVLETARVITDSSSRRYRVDEFGNVSQKTMVTPTGFWQYLKGSERIHPSFLLHGTVTGRTSSRGPNAQNFPKRGELAKMFRKIFVAPPGRVFLEADLSQAELRVAGWMAGESEMIRIYKNNGDIHSETAAATLGLDGEVFSLGRRDSETLLMDVANEWSGSGNFARMFTGQKRRELTVADYCDYKRYQAKAVNFGFLYGMGWRGFKRYAKLDYGIDLTDDEAQEMRHTFFRKYPGLKGWHEGMEKYVRDQGYVRSLHGALRRLPSVNSSEDNLQAMAVRQAINSPVQRFASDLGLIAMHRFQRDCPKGLADLSLFIHDANIIDVEESRAREVASNLKFYMESPPLMEWFGIEAPFPILSDVSVGPNLCDMDEKVFADIPAEAPEWYRAGESPADKALEDVWREKKRRQIILTDF